MPHSPTIALFVLALTTSAAPPTRPGREPGRPLVLVVHGRGQLARDTATVRREALTALRSGARSIMGDSLLQEGDVRLVWYADVLDPRTRRTGTQSASCDFRDAVAQRSGDAPVSVLSLLAMLAGAVLDADTSEATLTDENGLRSLAGDLRYLSDPDTRCAAERRLASALAQARDERRPVVVVAHSLGALVTWGYLKNGALNTLPDIRRLVTLGSPLGSAEVRQLVFGDEGSALSLPHGVREWVNVVNPDDPFAARIATAGRMTHVEEVVTALAEQDPHRLRGYLRDSVTARVVVGAWCEAFEGSRGAAQPSCAAILRVHTSP